MKKIAEHSGCGYGTQVDQMTLRLDRGDVVVQLSESEYAALRTKQPAASEGDVARATFEKWIADQFGYSTEKMVWDDKQYRFGPTGFLWEAWEASASARANTSKQAAGEAVDHATAMEGWEVAMCEISEIAGNSSDDRIIRRARRVQEWIEAHRPTPPRHPADEERDALLDAVLDWWHAHMFDTYSCGDDAGEANAYDEPPEFVRIALAALAPTP